MKFTQVLKSIGAVVAGFLVVVILSIVTDMIVEGIGFFPSASQPEAYTWWMLFIALIYRTMWTILGGYVTARLAPQRPMKHAVILGIIGTVAGIAGVIGAWSLGNHWYPILLAALALPSTWVGGMLQGKKR